MAREREPIDSTDILELLRVVEAVNRSQGPRVLRRDGVDVAVVTPIAKRPARGKPTSADDPLWQIVGIATSDGPGDVAEDKKRYLVEAYWPNEV